MKPRGNSDLARKLVADLHTLGIGVRETARIMEMSPGSIHYYRAQLGLKCEPGPATWEIIAGLPAAVRADLITLRGAEP